MVASSTVPTIQGSRCSCLPYITLSIRGLVEAGRIRPLARLMIISRKLPPSNMRRGLISAQTSGSTFLSLGLGREAVNSAAVALPVPRGVRSDLGMPLPPKPELRKEEDIALDSTPEPSVSYTKDGRRFRPGATCKAANNSLRSSPLAARLDEGAHAEENEDEAERAHDGLDLRRIGTRDRVAG